MINMIVTVNHLDEKLEPTQTTGKLIFINDNSIEMHCPDSDNHTVIELNMTSKIELV